MGNVIPNANAIGVIKLIVWSAYRIAALASWRSATHFQWDDLSPLGFGTAANERAKRCGSSDDAAAAEGVEDQGFEGGVGIDGDVAHALPGPERFDGAVPLGHARAVEAARAVVSGFLLR